MVTLSRGGGLTIAYRYSDDAYSALYIASLPAPDRSP
ncbi:hypothetical protein A2U01_0033955, partial [Trifolium medium]|nr:hypothetical protein [Trifolium medium]